MPAPLGLDDISVYRQAMSELGRSQDEADAYYANDLVGTLKASPNLKPEARRALNGLDLASLEPASVLSTVDTTLANIFPSDGGAIDALEQAAKGGTPQSFISNPANIDSLFIQEEPEELSSVDPFSFTDSELFEKNRDPGFFESVYKGWLNDKGFIQATAGLGANALGDFTDSDMLKAGGQTLLEWANTNFETADSINKADGTFGWITDLVAQQIPSAVLTLGTGFVAKKAAQTLLGAGAKKAARSALEKEIGEGLARQLGKNPASLEVKKGVKDIVTDDLVDSVSTQAIRQTYYRKGADAASKEVVEKLGSLVPKAGSESVGRAAGQLTSRVGGFRDKLINTYAPIVGTVAPSYGISTGAIYQELEEQRGEGDPEVVLSDVAGYGTLAAAVEALPGLYFLEKFGVLDRASFITKAINSADDTVKGAIAKSSLLEGSTEVVQGVISEAAKHEYIKALPSLEGQQKLELASYLLRPEALKRYTEEFIAGATVGGILGGAGRAVAGKQAQPDFKAEQEFIEKNLESDPTKTAAIVMYNQGEKGVTKVDPEVVEVDAERIPQEDQGPQVSRRTPRLESTKLQEGDPLLEESGTRSPAPQPAQPSLDQPSVAGQLPPVETNQPQVTEEIEPAPETPVVEETTVDPEAQVDQELDEIGEAGRAAQESFAQEQQELAAQPETESLQTQAQIAENFLDDMDSVEGVEAQAQRATEFLGQDIELADGQTRPTLRQLKDHIKAAGVKAQQDIETASSAQAEPQATPSAQIREDIAEGPTRSFVEPDRIIDTEPSENEIAEAAIEAEVNRELSDQELEAQQRRLDELRNQHYSLADQGVTPQEPRMTDTQVREWLDTQPVDFLRELDIEVTDTATFKREHLNSDKNVKWDGAFKDGKVYLNRDNITEENIERVLFHEGLGHGVAEKALGTEQFNRVMGDIIREIREFTKTNKDYTLPNGKKLSQLVNDYSQAYQNDPNLEKKLAGEIWANYIEAHADPQGMKSRSLISRVMEAVKKFFFGDRFEIANTEAAKLVRKARSNSLDVNRNEGRDLDFEATSDLYFSLDTSDKRANKDLIRTTWLSPFKNWFPSPDTNPDMNALGRYLSMPQWLAKKHPFLKEIYTALTGSSRREGVMRNRIMRGLSNYTNSSDVDAQAIDAVLVRGDREGVEYDSAQAAGLTEEQFKMYQDVRRELNGVRDDMVISMARARDLIDEKINALSENNNGVEAEILNKQKKELEAAINGLANTEGYIPRVRKGSKLLKYTDENNVPHLDQVQYDDGRTPRDNSAEYRDVMEQQKARLEARGIKVEEVPNANTQEKVFENMRNMDVDIFLASYLKDKDGNFPKEFSDAMQSILYAQSFRRHYIKRHKIERGDTGEAHGPDSMDSSVHGYQETNLAGVLADYVSGFSKQHARSEAAHEVRNIMTKTDEKNNGKLVFDPKENPREYKFVREMLDNANRSQDGLDRTVNFMNSAAFQMWIGGRVTSAVWNGMHIHMFGASLLKTAGVKKNPLELSKEFVNAHGSAAKYLVQRHKAKGPVTAEQMGIDPNNAEAVAQLDLLNQAFEVVSSQTLARQSYQDAIDKDASWMKQKWNGYSKIAGSMMHQVEMSNRLASVLAFNKNSDKKDLDSALDFADDLNANYDKFNMPKWLQGSGAAKFIQPIAFTFGTHVQNTYEMMHHMYKNDRLALVYGMGMMAMLGGLPAKEAAEGFMRLLTGKDLEQEIEEHVGKGAAHAARSGALFSALGIDAGRSLQLSAPPIFNLIGTLMGTNQETASLAPFMNMYKAYKGEQPEYKAIPVKWIQSIAQGYDGATDSVKVGRNRVYDASGQPMKLNGYEAFLQSLGFVPMRASDASREIFTESQLNRYWRDYKSRVLDQLQFAKTPIERMEARKAMREFNQDLRDIKRQGYRFLKTTPATPGDITDERRIKQLRGDNE